MLRAFASLPVIALVAGCTSIPDSERALLAEEIDCRRAEQQIAALQAARPTEGRRARALASTLTTGGFVIGAATGDLRDRERILSGEYAEEIDARIALIRESCGLPPQEVPEPA